MRKNQTTKTLLLLLIAFILVGWMRVSAEETPSQANIEKVLKAHFTDTEYATRLYKLTINSVQRGTPRLGDYATDGTPANKKVEVIPCKVIWTRVTTYTAGNPHVVTEQFNSECVFFLDEFNEWTFKLKKQDSKKL